MTALYKDTLQSPLRPPHSNQKCQPIELSLGDPKTMKINRVEFQPSFVEFTCSFTVQQISTMKGDQE
jgi:hypothetical protein